MVIILRKIDADTIYLNGRWRSDGILCYLHITARPLMQGHTATMVAAKDYTLIQV